MSQQLIQYVESKHKKDKPPVFRIGDTVELHLKIVEGEKQRIQIFTGLVIARSGSGLNETFMVRRIVANEGVERTFLLHSPSILKVKVVRSGKVRRAKLFYLRDRVGKARRLREKRVKHTDKVRAPNTDDKVPNAVPKPAQEPELAAVES